jgi:hypothetical protein
MCRKTKRNFISGFRKLKQLKNFEIQTSPYLPSIISIRGGVIPLLQAHGLTLEQLYLTVEVTSEQVFVIIHRELPEHSPIATFFRKYRSGNSRTGGR